MLRQVYRVFAAQAALVLASLAGAGAARAEVTLGASFGYTHLSYPDISGFSNDVVGVPGSVEWGQPGFRVGYLAPGGLWDLNLDVGLIHRSSNDFYDETTFELLPQAQLNVWGRRGLDGFVNVGGGIEHETAPISATDAVSATRAIYGIGVGVRKFVGERHGLVRLELRYDYRPFHRKELDPNSSVSFPATNLYSVKLGFDLLVTR